MKILKNAFLYIVLFFGLYWLLSIAKCEINTAKMRDEIIADMAWADEGDKIKVIYKNNCYMSVYIVPKEPYPNMGLLYHCGYNNDTSKWEDFKWECIWSRSGSADGFIWPYGR